MLIMQLSIIVPIAVVWWRRRHFSAPVKLLSWYVYLSVFCVLGGRLGAIYLHNNLTFLVAFNWGKIALLTAVYAQVLLPTQLRKLLLGATAVALVVLVASASVNLALTVDISRVTQCALLASFALVYLEQTLNHAPVARSFRDPLWLLSVGQLVYSAGTVTAFSLGNMRPASLTMSLIYICVAVSGLAFNHFLTLAFLRAQPDLLTAVGSRVPAYQAANS
jgi:hypothetical protein